MSDESHVSPYGITLREDGVIDMFPAIEVGLRTRAGGRLSLFFLIDSGAHISAMPASDAAVLGIDAAEGEPMLISGISGAPARGWRHTLSVLLGDETLEIPMVFLDLDSCPRVLGRSGVFGRYTVVFEEHRQRAALLGTKTKTARKVTEALDSLA